MAMKIKRAMGAGLVALAVASVAGCAESGPHASAEPAITVASPTPGSLGMVVFPLDAYRGSLDERNFLRRASDTLTAQCMHRFGLPWMLTEPDAPTISQDITAMQDLDEQAAARYGYHRPLASTPEQSVVTGISDDAELVYTGKTATYSGLPVPQGGCRKESDDRLAGGAAAVQLPAQLDDQAWHLMTADSRLTAATKSWSSCMQVAGLQYTSPALAANDLRWHGASLDEWAPVGQAEISVATQDARCRKQVSYLATQIALLTAYQEQLIDSNRQALTQVRQKVDRQLRAAATALGEPAPTSPSAAPE